MAKLKYEQNSALDIVDFIHFFDVYNLVSLSEEKTEFYDFILSLINNKIKVNNINTEHHHIFKHYIICGIEICFNEFESPDLNNYDDYSVSKEIADKVHKHNTRFSLAFLSILAEQKGIERNIIIDSVLDIVNIIDKRKYSLHLYYRLSNQILCHEYIAASLSVYKKFLDLGILCSSKYPEQKITVDNNRCEEIFTRAGLLIEFELYRRSFGKKFTREDKITLKIPKKFATNTHKENLIRYYKKLIENLCNQDESLKITMFFPNKCLNNKDNLSKFLFDIYEDFIHNRMFVKNNNGWVSTLGAFHILVYKVGQENIPIYSTLNNKDSASDLSSRILKYYGFTISAKNLYIHYKNLNEIHYIQVLEYYEKILKLPILLGWDNTDHLYHFSLEVIPS